MLMTSDVSFADYAAILWRRRWLVLGLFCLCLAFGAYRSTAPEQYMSTTSILVIPQRVSENYVRSTTSLRMEDRLGTIRQQVMSRTRLIAIMEELGLYAKERAARPIEEVVERMRKEITIEVKGNDSFTLSFVHRTPKTAMLATSRLASLFIEENVKARELQAVGTAEFLDSQLQETKKKLETQEERVKEYKSRFNGELPQQVQTNLQLLSRLQERVRTNSDAVRAAEDRKLAVQNQIDLVTARLVPREVREPSPPPQPGKEKEPEVQEVVYQLPPPPDPAQGLLPEWAARKTQLDALQAKYTDRHPEVIRMKQETAALERRIEELRSVPPEPPPAPVSKSVARKTVPSPVAPPAPAPVAAAKSAVTGDVEELRRLRGQLEMLDKQIASLGRDRADIDRSISQIDSKIEAAPRREQEMIAITRDYENLKQSYDDLLQKKLQADISQNLEHRQKGEQFQILDPANLPETPFAPKRLQLLLLSVAFGLLLGVGGGMGREYLDPSARTVREMKSAIDLPVLVVIPDARQLQEGRISGPVRSGLFAVFAAGLCSAGVVAILYGHKVKVLIASIGGVR